MSRLGIEKKNSIVMNSTGAYNKEISRGNISFIIPNEQPNTSEVNVSVLIKDIRFSHASVSHPEVTAIVNGSKLIASVPFKEALNYQFKRVEDQMVFKFAVSSEGDLLGFISLEIPQKFKTMKRFKLDDWFPVKHLTSEENEKMVKENFVAHIILEYSGSRKLVDQKTPGLKVPKETLIHEMAVKMKQKMNEIKNDIEQSEEVEEFRHLEIFSKKLLKKKVNLNSKGQHPEKPVRVNHPVDNEPNGLNLLAKTKTVLDNGREIKVKAIEPAQFFQKTITISKGIDKATADDSKFENLVKELAHSHQELVRVNQRITALEQGKLQVDNDKLKKDMDKIKQELTKDRKEISIKLKDSGSLLEQESIKTKKHFETETEKSIATQKEMNEYLETLRKQMESLAIREERAEELAAQISEQEFRISEKEKKYAEDKEYLERESKDIDEQETEMLEMRTRMMIERQRVCEETNHLQFLKGDTDLCTKQTSSLANYLIEEKEAFRLFVDKKNAEFSEELKQVEESIKQHDVSVKELELKQKELEAQNALLLEEKSKFRKELNKFEDENYNFEVELRDFEANQQLIDQDRMESEDNINKEYRYLEQKTQDLNEQQAEFDAMNEKLVDFEISLQNQFRIQQEQNQRFILQQKQFFKQLLDTNFEPSELKKFSEEIAKALKVNDDFFEESQKQEREFLKSRSIMKRSLDILNDKQLNKSVVIEAPESIVVRRYSKERKKSIIAVESEGAENQMKIQQEANKLTEEIFSKAALGFFSNINQQKDELIKNLKASILKLETKHTAMHKARQTSKLRFFTSTAKKNKSQVISNPFAENANEDVANQKLENSNPNMDPFDDDQEEVNDRLNDLQENLEDICDQVIQLISDFSGNQITPKVKERTEYIMQSRKLFQTIFSIIKEMNSEVKFIVQEDLVIDYENFDLNALKAKLEINLLNVISFIFKIKNNSEFFNNDIDGQIVSI